MTLRNRSLTAINDFTISQWNDILEIAQKIKTQGVANVDRTLGNTLVATLFFEPSTRTRLSFEAAALRLGAQTLGFTDAAATSVAKGESLEDTIRMVAGYSDAIVIRHPESGSAARAHAVSTVPIINAGDGANEHPTQTLLDLFSIKETQGRLDNLTIGFAGDLRYGRAAHSLMKAVAKYGNNTLRLIAPKQIETPKELLSYFDENNTGYTQSSDLLEATQDLDILYLSRIQKERFDSNADYEAVKNVYCFGEPHMAVTKDNFRLLHAFPRVNEIDTALDTHPKSYYFEQAANGVPLRMALLHSILA